MIVQCNKTAEELTDARKKNEGYEMKIDTLKIQLEHRDELLEDLTETKKALRCSEREIAELKKRLRTSENQRIALIQQVYKSYADAPESSSSQDRRKRSTLDSNNETLQKEL
ncbi:hypothetical protein L596_001206 [Steinernema carpocapsae]|uniref:Uncharacterized protein n=1 Tax=Steinernema carpocapsae TaxID=34508 RepID=A0A4U8UKA0_STECR|nr:hypothetical protein L596_001206 [Steinernema carpocapsae]